MKSTSISNKSALNIRKYVIYSLILWTIVMFLLLSWDKKNIVGIDVLSTDEIQNHFLTHFIIWILGIVIILIAFLRIKRSEAKRLLADNKLINFNKELEAKVELRSKELLKAELKWESIFKAIASPAQLIGKDHTIKYVNDATLDSFKCDREDLIGKNCCTIFHQSDKYPENCPLEKIKADQKSITEEIVVEALNKSFLISCTPILDSEGNLDSIIHIMTDISMQKTAEKLLKESQKKLDYIFETIPFAVNLVNSKGIILDCNSSLLATHGYTDKKELIGKPSRLLFPDFELDRAQKDIAKILKEGTTHRLSYTLKRKDGSTFPAEISSSIFNDETTQQKFLVSAAIDITERKCTEKELENHRLNLEELIQKRTREIEEKNEKLDRINKLFVGRELRMAELKKELERLKNQ